MHFLEMDDLTSYELGRVLDLSEAPRPPQVLAQKGVALLFEKPSARTRNSMEVAVVQLGGHPVTIRNEEVGLDVRESTEDVARVLSGYHAAIGARVFDHNQLKRLANAATVPVINLLSDDAHPIQVLADLLTIRQEYGRIDGLKVAYVGDANNMARSLAIGLAVAGSELSVAHPEGYGFDEPTLRRMSTAGAEVFATTSVSDAVSGADVVYTDAWYSMGQEDEKAKRVDAFARYQVDDDVMALAADNAIFLHCLPAHRGDEATDSVLDGASSRIWRQAENRLHSSRGLLAFLCGTDGARQ